MKYFWYSLTKNVNKFTSWKAKQYVLRTNAKNMFDRWISPMAVVIFLRSLRAYLRLYKAGFSITTDIDRFSKFESFSFKWNGHMPREFPGITRVDTKYMTVSDFIVEDLDRYQK